MPVTSYWGVTSEAKYGAGRSSITYPSVNSSQVQLQMKGFSARSECSLLFQRDSVSVGVPEEVDHTLIIIWGGFYKEFCFLNKGVGRMEGTHKYCQWEPVLPFTPPSAWRDENRNLLPEGRFGKDWSLVTTRLSYRIIVLSGGELEWRSAKGSLQGDQGNKTPPCTLSHPRSHLPSGRLTKREPTSLRTWA